MEDGSDPGSAMQQGVPRQTAYCPICGFRSGALNGDGDIIHVGPGDLDRLTTLFGGGFDHSTCDLGCPLDVTPTIAVVVGDPLEGVLLWGDTVEVNRRAALLSDLASRNVRQGESISFSEAQSPDELRRMARDLLTNRSGPFLESLEAFTSGHAIEHVKENWRSLTPTVLSAGYLLVRCILPGAKLVIADAIGKPQPPTETEELVARLQAAAWNALLVEWAAGLEPDAVTLESDFSSYLIGSGWPKLAFDTALASLAPFDRGALTSRERYCIEAFSASLSLLGGRDNPSVREWASIYVEFECVNSAHSHPVTAKMLISAERARKTLSSAALYEAILQLLREGGAKPEDVMKAADKAGRTQLAYDAARNLLPDGLFETDPLSFIDEYLQSVPPGVIGAALSMLSAQLIRMGNADLVERVADSALAKSTNDEIRAQIEAWLGTCLKEMREPERFLRRIGRIARPHEAELPLDTRLRLWTERSNALRLAGEHHDALIVIRAVEDLVQHDHEDNRWRIARLNRAILERETGAPDTAMEILKELADIPSGSDRLLALRSIAVTALALGDDNEALRALEDALVEAHSIDPVLARSILVERIQLLVDNDPTQALRELLLIANREQSASNVLPEAAAWARLGFAASEIDYGRLSDLGEEEDLARRMEMRLSEVEQGVEEVMRRAERSGDKLVALLSRRVVAWIGEAASSDEDGENPEVEAALDSIWQDLLRTAKDLGLEPTPGDLLTAALHRLRAKDLDGAHKLLSQVPRSVQGIGGRTTDLLVAAGLTKAMEQSSRNVINELLRIRPKPVADIRFVGELRRDALKRAQGFDAVMPSPGSALLENGLTNSDISGALADVAPVAVLEWIDTVPLLTWMDGVGRVTASLLTPPSFELSDLANQVQARLSGWTRKRTGDPFDMADWLAIEDWLVAQLVSRLPEGSHLVVIPSRLHPQMPWHVAARRHWVTSYVPSWTVLVDLMTRPPRRTPKCLFLGAVPMSGDRQAIMDAFQSLVSLLAARATSLGVKVIERVGTRCDRKELLLGFEQCEAAVILSHGYSRPQAGGVGLVLASDGGLPPMSSNLFTRPATSGFLLDWRQCQALESSPRLVVAGACSAGVSLVGGLEERFGIFSGLRRSGTGTFVAPRWEVLATDTCNLISGLILRILSGEPVGNALHNASVDAAAEAPPWRAWSMALEGDWR